jgi:hypothetical protein
MQASTYVVCTILLHSGGSRGAAAAPPSARHAPTRHNAVQLTRQASTSCQTALLRSRRLRSRRANVGGEWHALDEVGTCTHGRDRANGRQRH